MSIIQCFYVHRRVCLIPLDSRPVCYDMPRRMAAMAGLEACMPSPKLLGHLKQPADLKALSRWIKNHLVERDPVVVALDTIAYGGLISSRVGYEPLSLLEERVQKFFDTVQATRMMGFSSIQRIPSYNGSEEEPDYWAQYGKALYQYSAQVHQSGQASPELLGRIPAAVLQDFLARRERNFALNQRYFDYLEQKRQDDTGAFGMNVQEARLLEAEIARRGLTGHAHLQTGADEVACCMLARWLSLSMPDHPVSVYPVYSSEAGRQLIARFDGLPIEAVVNRQITACGATVAKTAKTADLWLFVHTPTQRQGDHCDRILAVTEPAQHAVLKQTLLEARKAKKPLAIADVAYANGSDPEMTPFLVSQLEDLSELYGYAGWNTPGNTIGTAVSMSVIRLLAEKRQQFHPEEFRKLMLIRFADDWLYQADVRATLRQTMNGVLPAESLLNAAMADGLTLLKQRLNLAEADVHCRFPCGRTFEIEVAVS
jgi:hypothetical protein